MGNHIEKPLASKVLIIGWDGADWKAINPLLDAGKMPALKRFINQGVMGNIVTLDPPLSPMLWTSIATGMRPFKHGIHGFTEPDPHTGGVRPVANTSRRVKAVWNILNQQGLRSNVIGWWPSHPAEPINGVMVSNHYHRASAPVGRPWPLMPGTIHPERLAEPLADLRIHPAELTAQQILPFVPGAAGIDPAKDPRLGMVARILANCATVQACATAVMQLEPWDFMAVYYDAIDHFSHGFMKYHPPRQAHIREEDFNLYSGVVEAGYRFHDMMLGVIMKLAGEDTTVILVSDHGFHPGDLRPSRIPHVPAGPAVEHSPYGIFAMKGPGVRHDELIYGASLLDVAPTILTLFGLPVGEDMDGKVLAQCFNVPPVIRAIKSWEKLAGNDGRHPAEVRLNPVAAREALKQLVALGYIEDPGEDKQKAVDNTVNEGRFNVARAYMDANRYAEALSLLEALWAGNPNDLRYGNHLSNCYLALNRLAAYCRTIEAILDTQARLSDEARQKLREYGRGKKPSEIDTEGMSEAEKAEHGKRIEQYRSKVRRLQEIAAPRKHWRHYLKACIHMATDRPAQALDELKQAEKAEPRLPGLHIQIGRMCLKLNQWKDAERAFSKALEIDPDDPQAHLGRCRSLLPVRQNRAAAEAALTAAGLLYHYPQAHFHLGVALHRIGRIDRAVDALQVALAQNPYYLHAHKRLAYIYRVRLKNSAAAEHHQNQVKELRKQRKKQKEGFLTTVPPKKECPVVHVETAITPIIDAQQNDGTPASPMDEIITVVSGLPRSGTSMMMQMLQAGGRACLTDGARHADADNPLGYYELEKAKRLQMDNSWLPESKGKTIKIVAQLLSFLPAKFHYRVIFMERDLDEILASQRRMLDRQNRKGAELSSARLAKTFAHQVQQSKTILSNRKIPTLYVSYGATLENPGRTAGQLQKFLGGGLNADAMIGAVVEDLYRSRRNCN